MNKDIFCNDSMFVVDPTNPDGLREIMDKFGDSDHPFGGKNEQGEDVLVSVNKDSITVRTFQKNGWMRLNTYSFIDGELVSEQTFDGR